MIITTIETPHGKLFHQSIRQAGIPDDVFCVEAVLMTKAPNS